MPKSLKLIISILVCHLAGFIGSFATSSSVNTWYATLTKPSFNPPNWLFAPVWLALYTLMGISLYLLWIKLKKKKQIKSLIIFFFFSLLLNTIWSPVFFGFHNLGLALAIIFLLWLTILAMIYTFYEHSKWASILLIPYLLWVSFAGILNLALWYLN
jgi:benzodiazapine receptor